MYYTTQDHITAHLARVESQTAAAEEAAYLADREFGPDWEDNSREPEDRVRVSYWDVKDANRE